MQSGRTIAFVSLQILLLTANGALTSAAVVRVLAFDGRGLMGSDTSDGPFTISGPSLLPPNPVDGATLSVLVAGTDLRFSWKAPERDPNHGPAERYDVVRAENPSGPFTEVAVVTGDTRYSEPLAATEGASVFYKFIAANAAGEGE